MRYFFLTRPITSEEKREASLVFFIRQPTIQFLFFRKSFTELIPMKKFESLKCFFLVFGKCQFLFVLQWCCETEKTRTFHAKTIFDKITMKNFYLFKTYTILAFLELKLSKSLTNSH